MDTITVEVAFALPHKQKILTVLVEPGTTALEAAKRSGITTHFPEVDLETAPMGIFGQTLGTKGLPPAHEYQLQPGDRIEIYRPLQADPKEARQRRAQKQAE